MTDPRSELRVVKAGERDRYGVRHVRFHQMYKGLEVHTGDVIAHFNRQDVFDRISGVFYTGINLPTTPVISREAALDIVAKDRGRDVKTLDVRQSELLVYPRDSTYYLAWHIGAVMGGEYFIDALTGRVIYHWSGIREARPAEALPEPTPPSDSVQRRDTTDHRSEESTTKPDTLIFPLGTLRVDTLDIHTAPVPPPQSLPPPRQRGRDL